MIYLDSQLTGDLHIAVSTVTPAGDHHGWSQPSLMPSCLLRRDTFYFRKISDPPFFFTGLDRHHVFLYFLWIWNFWLSGQVQDHSWIEQDSIKNRIFLHSTQMDPELRQTHINITFIVSKKHINGSHKYLCIARQVLTIIHSQSLSFIFNQSLPAHWHALQAFY